MEFENVGFYGGRKTGEPKKALTVLQRQHKQKQINLNSPSRNIAYIIQAKISGKLTILLQKNKPFTASNALYKQVELEFGNVGFYGGRKTGEPGEDPRSKDENQQQTQPRYDTGAGNQTRATLMEGERSHHCAIPTPPLYYYIITSYFYR